VDPDGQCYVLPDGRLDCLGPSLAAQAALHAGVAEALHEGNYGQVLVGSVLAVANAATSVPIGYAVQTVVAPYNASFDATTGFQTGNYKQALRGSLELLVIFGGARLTTPKASPAPRTAPQAEPAAATETTAVEATPAEPVAAPQSRASGSGTEAARATSAPESSASAPAPSTEPRVTADELRRLGRGRFEGAGGSKAEALQRSGGVCEHCGKPTAAQGDHMRSLQRYATDVNEGSLTVEEAVEASSAPENIAASCGGRGGCNPIKGARELSNEPGPGRFVPEEPTPRVQTQMDINDVTSGRQEP